MSKDLVVKTNRLNQAFQMLTLAELHIVQLAIVDARETGTGLSTNQPLRIDAMRYAEVFNTTRQNAYQRMKSAEDTLFNRRFSYFDSEGKLVKVDGYNKSGILMMGSYRTCFYIGCCRWNKSY